MAEGGHWDPRAIAAVLAAEAAFRGRPADARRHLRCARAGGLLLRERGAGGWAAPQLIAVPVVIDDLDEATAVIGEARAAARSSGASVVMFAAMGSEGWRNTRRGALVAAEADLLGILRFSRLAAMPMVVANIAAFFLDVLLERETVAELADEIERAQLPPEFLATYSGASLLETRGRLRLVRHERDRGIADLRVAGQALGKLRFGPTLSSWRSGLALALRDHERDEALALVDEELRLARATGLPRPIGVALRARGVLASDPGDGVELLRESVAVLERSPAPRAGAPRTSCWRPAGAAARSSPAATR